MNTNTHIVLLHSDSRESINKASQMSLAAFSLGYIATTILYQSIDTNIDKLINIIGNVKVDLVLSCSDSLTWCAIKANAYYGIIPPTDIRPFISKSKGYDLFAKAGFDVLPHHPIKDLNDLINSPLKDSVFIKPDYSSGVHSISEWGYKQFPDVDAFIAEICDNVSSLATFDQTCNNPYARLMAMDYVPHDGVYCISAVLREDKVTCFGHSFMKISGDDYFYDYVLYEDLGKTNLLESLVAKLWENGFRSNFLYLQCLMKDGILYPMDINTRLSTYLDTLATYFDPKFYANVLNFILGKVDSVKLNIPKHCLIGRIKCNPHIPIKNIVYKSIENVTYLNFGKTTISNVSYDKAYSWPTYVCFGDSSEDVLEKHFLVQKNTTVEQ